MTSKARSRVKGQLEDPFGHLWWVATHKEDIPPDEMQRRVEAMFAGQK